MPAATRGPRQFDQRPGGKILEHMLEHMIDILAHTGLPRPGRNKLPAR
jgi:hypothetical protein